MTRPTGDPEAPSEFRFEYRPGTIRFGRESAATLEAELDRLDRDRALLVCGRTVGDTPAVRDPVVDGLGRRLAGVFAETTPEKRLSTAAAGLRAFRDADADAVVGLGGGSSLDVAKWIAALAAADASPATVGRAVAATGSATLPPGDAPPVVTVPTTLAGAALSRVAGVTVTPALDGVDESAAGGLSDSRIQPSAVVYDPALVETTPTAILSGSAMNGFDKGVETLYARNRTAITDATAAAGLELLGDALPALGEGRPDSDLIDRIVEGTLLAEYGVSRPDGTTLSVVHAFGHGLTRGYPVQQGVAHAVIAPHALRYVFSRVDGRRDRLADALGVGDAADPAAGVVDRVASIRDALDLPSRLRDVDGPDVEEARTVAAAVLDDAFMANAPRGLDPSVDDLADVVRAAW